MSFNDCGCNPRVGHTAPCLLAEGSYVKSLHVSTTDAKPVDMDWTREAYEDGEDDWQAWEVFTYEASNGESYELVATGASVVGVVLGGVLYTDFETWEEANPSEALSTQEADMEEQFGLTEDRFQELMEAEPYQYGAEGPMMNYWYPLEETEGGYASFDPAEAAAKLGHLPVCVVLVDGAYGLALTGGGMDLSWQVCDAYVSLGKCPPVHFADLPAYAEAWGERHERVYAAMCRSLEVTIRNAEHRLSQLGNLRSRMSGGN